MAAVRAILKSGLEPFGACCKASFSYGLSGLACLCIYCVHHNILLNESRLSVDDVNMPGIVFNSSLNTFLLKMKKRAIEHLRLLVEVYGISMLSKGRVFE
jgi:hypothetical protein